MSTPLEKAERLEEEEQRQREFDDSDNLWGINDKLDKIIKELQKPWYKRIFK